MSKVDPQVIGRRGELLAELFLQNLKPAFVAQATRAFEYDFLAGFSNTRGGINNIPVEVKATERPLHGHFVISKKQFDRYTHSNIPVLLLVIDVKENKYYYAWLGQDTFPIDVVKDNVRIRITEIDGDSKKELLDKLRA